MHQSRVPVPARLASALPIKGDQAGQRASQRFLQFFTAIIRNSPPTSRRGRRALYDRTKEELSLEEIERIVI